MIKKFTYRFMILFLIITMCVNTYSFTRSEASSAGISTAIQYFVDFAVSYLGYSANKQDRVSIANQLIKAYSTEKEKLYDFSKKLIFASWTKTLNFLGNKVGAFESDMKKYLTYVKSLLFNNNDYIVNDKISDFQTDTFVINGQSKTVNYKLDVTKNVFTIPIEDMRVKGISDLTGKTFYINDFYINYYNSDLKKLFNTNMYITFLGKDKCKVYFNNRLLFNCYENGLVGTLFSDIKSDMDRVVLSFNIDNVNYTVTEYMHFITNGAHILYNEALQDYFNYFFRNSVVKADKRSLSNTLNSASAVKTIVKDIDLTSQDYNIIVDKVLEKLPELDNYVTDSSSNTQLLNYTTDGVINREIDTGKKLTGSDIVNLNVDKLLEKTGNIADEVKQNSSLLKKVYDSVVNSREAILKLGVDLAAVNTSALSIASDLAAVRSATDVISSDTFSKSLSDSVSTSVSQSIGKTISTTLDNKFGNKDNKRINLDPLKNLIIKEKFPFSLPFDLKDTITTMKSKQIIPNFDLKIKGYHMNVNFSMFDSLVKKARPFFLLMFCVFLVLATKQILS